MVGTTMKLPNWLYYSAKTSQSISPAAVFDPCAAFEDQPWASNAAPSGQQLAKTIVITNKSFVEVSLGTQKALHAFLESEGFYLHYLKEDEDFNPETSYKKIMEEIGVSRDHIAVLDSKRMQELLACVQAPKFETAYGFQNNFKFLSGENTADVCDEGQFVCRPVDGLTVNMDDIVLLFNNVLKENNKSFFIRSFSDIKSNVEIISSIHALFLEDYTYRELISAIKSNIVQYVHHNDPVCCLMALLLPELRKYLTVTMLCSLADDNSLIAKFILSDDEFRSRLSIADIRHIFLNCDENLEQYYEIVPYTDDLSSCPFLLEINELNENTVPNLEKATTKGLLDFTKIKSIKLDFSIPPPEYQDARWALGYEFNVLYDFIAANFFNIELIETPDLYLHQLKRLEDSNSFFVVSNTGKPEPKLEPKREALIKPGILYIHNDVMRDSVMDSRNDGATANYNMVEGGEVLSRDFSLPRVRTARVRYSYDCLFQRLHTIVVRPVKSIPVEFYFENDSWVEDLRSQNNDYYYAKFSQTLLSGCYTRLLSIHAHEYIAGVVTDDGRAIPDLLIVHGDDGFYHALSNSSVNINFVVAIEKKYYLEDIYKQLNIDDPIQEIIDEYCLESQGYSEITDSNKPIPKLEKSPSYEAWCEQLFQERAGVCWHRALAVSEKIKMRLPGHAYRIEIVAIDNNHVALEVFNNGNYISVDLGGSANFTETYQQSSRSESSGLDDLAGASDSVEIPKLESSTVSKIIKTNKLAPFLMKSISPYVCDSVPDFFEAIENSQYQKILLRVDSTEKTANFLLKKYTKNECIFFIDAITLLTAQKENVVIDQHQDALYTNVTPLESFLQKSAGEINVRYFLLIDIRQTVLDAKTLGSINTLFDTHARKISGCCVPDNICVISITDQMPDDSAFLSRQDIILDLNMNLISNNPDHKKTDIFTVDLQGASNWKKALFGAVVLNNNKMLWLPSEFSRQCSSFSSGIEIIVRGFHKEDRKQMEKFLAKSTSLGYFDYHGHRIPIPEGITFNFNNGYDFSCFNSQYVIVNATADNISENHYEINADTFDLLLQDKIILNGVYNQKSGLLETYSCKTLHLFITSRLADNQWWVLFSVAEKNGVKLELMLAPTIPFPDSLPCEKVEAVCRNVAEKECVFVTNNTSAVAAGIYSENDIVIIDVEDYSFQDLFYAISFKKNQGEFSDFSICKSDVLSRLINGDTVILKGEFSDDLLSYIKTLLFVNPYLWINGEKLTVRGKLILIIEDKNLILNPASVYGDSFRWLGHIAGLCYEKAPTLTPNIINEPDYSGDPSLEKEDAIAFIENRIKIFFDVLQENSLLQLISEAGKGKSRLMQIIESEYSNHFTFYREMDSFERFANDYSDKIKILFIDESNIDDFHYTMFSPLKRGGSGQVLYRGKIYWLNENHRIVFARNPNEYGAGRMAQKLFEDGSIPEYHFSDFSPAYIYHELLKPIFDLANLQVSEDNFKKDCGVFIENYFANKNMTVRQLQQMILLYCLAQKENHSPFQANPYGGFFC